MIEDSFADGCRPNWEAGGAQFVTSVEAHEHMKLRCLNGTHSTMAYLGCLSDFETVKDAISDRRIETLCQHLWTAEIVPTLAQPQGEDLDVYTHRLLERYRNGNIRHLTAQIAQDGSQKLPQRILAPLLENIEAGRRCDGLAFVFAAWVFYLGKEDPIDPLRDSIVPVARAERSASERVRGILSLILTETAGVDDKTLAAAQNHLSEHLAYIEDRGVEAALDDLLRTFDR